MKLIPLEEILTYLKDRRNHRIFKDDGKEWAKNDEIFSYVVYFDSLPTIDPIAIIDDMIEEYTGTQTLTDPLIVCAFQELKSRLSLNQK